MLKNYTSSSCKVNLPQRYKIYNKFLVQSELTIEVLQNQHYTKKNPPRGEVVITKVQTSLPFEGNFTNPINSLSLLN